MLAPGQDEYWRSLAELYAVALGRDGEAYRIYQRLHADDPENAAWLERLLAAGE